MTPRILAAALVALVPTAALADCVHGPDPDTCDAVERAVTYVNGLRPGTLDELASNVRLRPTSIYDQLADLRASAAACTSGASNVDIDWVMGGTYTLTTLEGESDIGPFAGTVNRRSHQFFGQVGSGFDFVGLISSQYRGDGRVFGDLNATDWVAGHWIRVSGGTGVYVVLSGSCDVPLPDPFEPWYGAPLQWF